MNTILRALGVIALTWLLQVMVFRFGVFSNGWLVICFHLYGLILLPLDLPKVNYLIIGAVTGALLDVVILTGGLHMAAGAFVGLMIPKWNLFITPRDGFIQGHSISVSQDGWGRFIILSFLITFSYMFVLFAVEGFKWSLISSSFAKAMCSSVLNVILFSITQGLFGPKPKTKGPKVSAYPWS
jgi:hypothetical protein